MYLIAIVLIFIDQFSKFLIRQGMFVNESIPLLKNIFHITYVENTGIAFGLFPQGQIFFIAISLVVILFIIFLDRKRLVKSPGEKYYLGLVLGGALGNLIDRLRFGFVIDFLDFRVWPVFNLADSAVCIGGILMAISIIWSRPRKQKDVG